MSILLLGKVDTFAQVEKPALATLLDRIARDDQKFRGKVITRKAEQYGWDAPEVRAIWKKQERLDAINLKEIEKIIAQFGYPGKTLVGESRKSIVFLVIQHADLETRMKYLPVLKKAAESGEISQSSFAIMMDRNEMDEGRPQLYGSQLREIGRERKIYPIVNEHEVDLRRAAVGLEPLAVYLKKNGIAYQLPTAQYNPNPKSIYFSLEAKERPTIEIIGGIDELYSKLVYPKEAKEKGIVGKVTVELTVDQNGHIKHLAVVRGLGAGCDEEAVRVMKTAKFKNYTGGDHEIRMNLPFPYQK